MTLWHPLIDPNRKGATADTNLYDMAVIRGLSDERNILSSELDENLLILTPPEIEEAQHQIHELDVVCKEAMQAMVLANIPLVMFKVESYIALSPKLGFLQHDLVSEGVLGLTTAVDKLSKMKAPEDGGNPTAFIAQRISWTIGWFVDNDKKQNIPYDYSPPLVCDVDPTAIVDMQDLLEAACQTEEDLIIMEMRGRGCVDQEIADRLSIARSSVQVQRHELMQRYDALVQETL